MKQQVKDLQSSKSVTHARHAESMEEKRDTISENKVENCFEAELSCMMPPSKGPFCGKKR